MSLLSSINATSSSSSNTGAFVHLFEWSWSDVATECETFLGPKGYSGVQVSPPMEHIQGDQWWTRYQPVSYSLVSRSGDRDGFSDMVKRCGEVGVDIIADVVINHMAAGSGTGTDGTSYGGRSFPLYSPDDFHHNKGDTSANCQVSDYTDQYNVQNCDLVSLPDLCTSCDSVKSAASAYINDLQSLGVAGIRLDAAKHMEASELGGLLSAVDSGLYRFQEVIGAAGEAVTTDMYTGNGDVTEFSYAQELGPNIVNSGKMQYLENFGEEWGLMDASKAVVFMDNHDTQRGNAPLTYKDGDVYTFSNLFMLAHPYGYPKVMSSYYFSDHDQGPPSTPVHSGGSSVNCDDGSNWVCEHRRTPIANMVGFRNAAGSDKLADFQAPGADTIAFGRGSSAWIALNRGSSDWSVSGLKTSLAAGDYCNVIVDDDPSTCPKVTVNSDGTVGAISVPSLSAVAVHKEAKA